ncbi:MAG: L,D-transpeptidase family protein [Proteobacteria bacterium]|nr:L,D-transpeptidase family protein [Pseudomonadota bacterium]
MAWVGPASAAPQSGRAGGTDLALLPGPRAPGASGIGKADSILVLKGMRKLFLFRDGRLLRSYAINLGWSPKGHKEEEGDGRTPEGLYIIDGRNPNSGFHLSLHISYPNEVDLARAAHTGFSAGGDIMIHGIPNARRKRLPRDWTEGCIAVSNAAIHEIWQAVDDGTPIEIRP